MTKIFIEAKSKDTSECHFIQTIINLISPEMEVDFIPMNGIGNLFKEAILNQIKVAQEIGEQVIVFADADTITKKYGYVKRKGEIDKEMEVNAVSFPYFLYPNNQDDGDVEILMEAAARQDLHPVFFGCFKDYEICVSGAKDDVGNPKYNVPSLKNKLHTYMAAQNLSRKYRDRLGKGDWLFENKDYWDLDIDALKPLKEFLAANLK